VNAVTIGIVGLGLIGGSLGRAWKKESPHTVYGCDTDQGAQKKALLLGACDGILDEKTLPEVDILIFAVNPRTVAALLPDYLPRLKRGALVSDIAGNKRSVCAAFRAAQGDFPHLHFIAAHPMAGREFWGVSHSTPALFKRASALIIPLDGTPISVVSAYKTRLLEAGFERVKFTAADEHDRMIAYTSQLPHVLSGCYVQSPLAAAHDGFSAGSFLDLTRVARANAPMWAELFLDNRDNLLAMIDAFSETLAAYRAAIEAADEPALKRLIENGNAAKEEIDKNTRALRCRYR
jgi:prephenate dehydrogenase